VVAVSLGKVIFADFHGMFWVGGWIGGGVKPLAGPCATL
jgi:hypothetical protein